VGVRVCSPSRCCAGDLLHQFHAEGFQCVGKGYATEKRCAPCNGAQMAAAASDLGYGRGMLKRPSRPTSYGWFLGDRARDSTRQRAVAVPRAVPRALPWVILGACGECWMRLRAAKRIASRAGPVDGDRRKPDGRRRGDRAAAHTPPEDRPSRNNSPPTSTPAAQDFLGPPNVRQRCSTSRCSSISLTRPHRNASMSSFLDATALTVPAPATPPPTWPSRPTSSKRSNRSHRPTYCTTFNQPQDRDPRRCPPHELSSTAGSTDPSSRLRARHRGKCARSQARPQGACLTLGCRVMEQAVPDCLDGHARLGARPDVFERCSAIQFLMGCVVRGARVE
jgi:hypothetical protein